MTRKDEVDKMGQKKKRQRRGRVVKNSLACWSGSSESKKVGDLESVPVTLQWE